MTDQDEGDRLRRQLRAMSAVNEQLRAQLDAAQTEARTAPRQQVAVDPLADPTRPVPVGLAPRRASIAADWLEQLPRPEPGMRGEVVQAPDGALFLVEGDTRRRVRAGLLAAAIESVVGERRPADHDELRSLAERAPVEVLEGASGLPFVVIGGQRHEVRGLPLPFPVDQVDVDRLAVGPDLDLPASLTPRRAHEADGWILDATRGSGGSSRLVTTPDGSLHVIEGQVRRAVRSGLLAPALESLLGPAQPISDAELGDLGEGPDVAILEADHGLAFVVLGAKRCSVTGYVLPFPVHQRRADALPDGPTLDVAGAQRAVRRELTHQRNRATGERDRATGERDRATRKLARVEAELETIRRREAKRKADPNPLKELRALVRVRGGVVPAAGSLAKKAAKAGRRRLRSSSR